MFWEPLHHVHNPHGNSGAPTTYTMATVAACEPKGDLGFSNPKMRFLVTGNPEPSIFLSCYPWAVDILGSKVWLGKQMTTGERCWPHRQEAIRGRRLGAGALLLVSWGREPTPRWAGARSAQAPWRPRGQKVQEADGRLLQRPFPTALPAL